MHRSSKRRQIDHDSGWRKRVIAVGIQQNSDTGSADSRPSIILQTCAGRQGRTGAKSLLSSPKRSIRTCSSAPRWKQIRQKPPRAANFAAVGPRYPRARSLGIKERDHFSCSTNRPGARRVTNSLIRDGASTRWVTALTVVDHQLWACEGERQPWPARQACRSLVCSAGDARHRAGQSQAGNSMISSWSKKRGRLPQPHSFAASSVARTKHRAPP